MWMHYVNDGLLSLSTLQSLGMEESEGSRTFAVVGCSQRLWRGGSEVEYGMRL